MSQVPYVIVVWTPHPGSPEWELYSWGNRRSFTLNRQYDLLADFDQVFIPDDSFVRCEDPWVGWKPTNKAQMPEWAWELPEADFTATWILKKDTTEGKREVELQEARELEKWR